MGISFTNLTKALPRKIIRCIFCGQPCDYVREEPEFLVGRAQVYRCTECGRETLSVSRGNILKRASDDFS